MTDRRRNADSTLVVEETPEQPRSRISWGAVLAGALVALMVMLLINLVTLGIGLRAIDPATEQDPFSGVGTGTMIGIIIANALALFAGGWTAGRLANKLGGTDASLHGILTWGLVTLLSFWLLATAVGQLVSGVTGLVGQGLSLAGQGVSAVAPDAAQAVEDALSEQGVTLEGIREETSQLVETDEEAAPGETVSSLVERFFTEEGQVDRQELVDALTQNTELSEEEAEQQVSDWEERYQQAAETLDEARQSLEQAAEEASDAVGAAAIWAFIGLLIGAAIAILGSMLGRPKSIADARMG